MALQRILAQVYGILSVAACLVAGTTFAGPDVEKYGVFEAEFTASGQYANPYLELAPEAEIKAPDGVTRKAPLFWDGESTWRLRISPEVTGEWRFTVHSTDQGLNAVTGVFNCVSSGRRGSLQPMKGFPRHFEYQNGTPMWFMGDTAWALFTDNQAEKHDRSAAEQYMRVRAEQGFNVVHSMQLSEAGWGNQGGLPFHDITVQTLNPGYWQEMDQRIVFANRQGLIVGLAIAWGDKRKQEPFAWRRFPHLQARQRYARYIAARYAAYEVYFLVSGEWHAEIRTRPGTESEVRQEFIAIGNALQSADVHQRMIGIHPMTQHGSVREFNGVPWMAFGDYQQNYSDLHLRILESRKFQKPVVNSEYGYHLRDQNGDGTPDKDNSTSLESIRFASWDIVMAGGYLVTGFGTTYFGGHRDPGPFDVAARKNDGWELQIGFLKQFFTGLEWWKFEPRDERVRCDQPRSKDGRQLGQTAPPATAYWLLAHDPEEYLVYARGVTAPLEIQVDSFSGRWCQARLFNPRTGEKAVLPDLKIKNPHQWTPPSNEDWVLHLHVSR